MNGTELNEKRFVNEVMNTIYTYAKLKIKQVMYYNKIH